MRFAGVAKRTNLLIPPTPRGKYVSISKERSCGKDMLEVVENKGANLRLKNALMRLAGGKERFGRGLVRTNTTQDSTTFTACQMISCKYKYLNGLRGWTSSIRKRPV